MGPPWSLEGATLFSHLRDEEESELDTSVGADAETEGDFWCLYGKDTRRKLIFSVIVLWEEKLKMYVEKKDISK